MGDTNFMQLLSERYSCRKYTDEPVSRADIEAILTAGNVAPVGSSLFDNLHFTVVTDRAVLDALCEPLWVRLSDRATITEIIGDVEGDTILPP